MPQMKVGNEYYTAAQVKEKLGITQGTLYNYVRNGTLKPVTPPGKRQGVYSRKEVDQLAHELRAFMATRQKSASIFARATAQDVSDCAKLSDDFFSGLHFDVEKQIAWMKKNPDICYVVKDEGKVVGYVLMLPLAPQKIERFLRGEESSLDLETEDIEEFIPGKPVHIYMASIVVTSKGSLFERRTYGARLVGGLFKVLIDLGKRGIILKTIAARSSKPDGIRLLRGIGFTELLSNTDRKNFVIDVGKSGIKEIVEYKQALKESGVFTFPQDMNELPGDILTGASMDISSENGSTTPTTRKTTVKKAPKTGSRLDTTKTGAKPTV
ncbi:MAG TPA: helix-turn-helix domain-containing protein [Ktedonobacteraceae bacterium]|nr:helix-turn-helix domain-containing protein [Ktedonobacteraceae bacterium]